MGRWCHVVIFEFKSNEPHPFLRVHYTQTHAHTSGDTKGSIVPIEILTQSFKTIVYRSINRTLQPYSGAYTHTARGLVQYNTRRRLLWMIKRWRSILFIER